jgi:regulator of protease activity HflC (stomatin/prohibitin superfamily)
LPRESPFEKGPFGQKGEGEVLEFLSLGWLFTVEQQTAAIVERFGRFRRIATAGLNLKLPLIDRVAGRLSLRVQQLDVNVESKASDDVFVVLAIAVQYYVIEEKVKEAFYRLTNPHQQIESFVFDLVRAEVPKMTLDEVFQKKDAIAQAVKDDLSETMDQYGYGIVKALVNDIDPDHRVKDAMNEVRAAERQREAAIQKGEAAKILRVKEAEGEAESKRLQGEGLAAQRKAIAEGLRQSVDLVTAGAIGVDEQTVINLLLLVQYMDTLKDIAANTRSNTLFLPHSPGALGELFEQIRNAVLVAEAGSARHES